MKELELCGGNLGRLHEYLKRMYSGIDCCEEKIGGISVFIFVSVKYGPSRSWKWLYSSEHNMGCFIQFKKTTPTRCVIRIWVAGGGKGFFNIGGEEGMTEMEKAVYEDIKENADNLGLKVLS